MAIHKVLVVGLAKTGTTALFEKIRNAIPGETESCFEGDRDAIKRLISVGYKKSVVAKVLVGSPHPPLCTDRLDSFHKRILIVRDPRDRIVSGLMYRAYARCDIEAPDSILLPHQLDSLIKQLQQKERSPAQYALSDIMGVDLRKRFPVYADAYQQLFEIQKSGKFHVVKYEDMVSGRLGALEDYLNLELEPITTVSSEFARVARSQRSGDWKHFLTQHEVDQIRVELHDAVTNFGYPDDWTIAANPTIDKEYCSEYVKRVVELSIRDLRNEVLAMRAANHSQPPGLFSRLLTSVVSGVSKNMERVTA